MAICEGFPCRAVTKATPKKSYSQQFKKNVLLFFYALNRSAEVRLSFNFFLVRRA
jgi:hypothetical protein